LSSLSAIARRATEDRSMQYTKKQLVKISA
jgi:hypothetical protein